MKNLVKYSASVLCVVLSSCWAPRIDEKYAASVVKDKLSLSGNVSAQKLSGGLSGASLFLATDGSKKYVIRFIKNKPQKDRELEIYNLKVAATGGCGPQIYFADPLQGIIIMEYLPGKVIAEKDLQSDQFYIALAHLLRKIHQGQAFKSFRPKYDVFRRISHQIQIAKPKYGDYVPLIKVEHVVTVIHQAVLPYLTIAPCHNDLHGENLIFSGDEFRAIDYEDAAPGEPYFDLATTVSSNFYAVPARAKTLFTKYLGRQPTAAEEAKLYLMRQAILIKWAFDGLDRLSPEIVHQYKLIKAPPLIDFAKEGKPLVDAFDLSKPENSLKFLKALLNQVFTNFESQEFKDAVKTLGQQNLLEKK